MANHLLVFLPLKICRAALSQLWLGHAFHHQIFKVVLNNVTSLKIHWGQYLLKGVTLLRLAVLTIKLTARLGGGEPLLLLIIVCCQPIGYQKKFLPPVHLFVPTSSFSLLWAYFLLWSPFIWRGHCLGGKNLWHIHLQTTEAYPQTRVSPYVTDMMTSLLRDAIALATLCSNIVQQHCCRGQSFSLLANWLVSGEDLWIQGFPCPHLGTGNPSWGFPFSFG